MFKMSWNMLEILFVVTLIIGIASSSPIDEIKGNNTLTTLSKNSVSEETKSLLVNSTEIETIEFRKLHIDEESPKNRDGDEGDDDSEADVVDTDLKYEVEILQPGKIEKEDIEIEERFKGPSLNFDTNEFYDENIEVNGQTMQQGHVILTVALFALALVSIGIYAALVIWRSHLEKRYGMRQRLMTEDDFCANIDDTRPF